MQQVRRMGSLKTSGARRSPTRNQEPSSVVRGCGASQGAIKATWLPLPVASISILFPPLN